MDRNIAIGRFSHRDEIDTGTTFANREEQQKKGRHLRADPGRKRRSNLNIHKQFFKI